MLYIGPENRSKYSVPTKYKVIIAKRKMAIYMILLKKLNRLKKSKKEFVG